MKKLKCIRFFNSQKLLDFVSDENIKPEDIASIINDRDTYINLYYWDQIKQDDSKNFQIFCMRGDPDRSEDVKNEFIKRGFDVQDFEFGDFTNIYYTRDNKVTIAFGNNFCEFISFTQNIYELPPLEEKEIKYDFKPKEWILRSDSNDSIEIWVLDRFSHIDKDGSFYCISGFLSKNILPEKGNEHLLGTKIVE